MENKKPVENKKVDIPIQLFPLMDGKVIIYTERKFVDTLINAGIIKQKGEEKKSLKLGEMALK